MLPIISDAFLLSPFLSSASIYRRSPCPASILWVVWEAYLHLARRNSGCAPIFS